MFYFFCAVCYLFMCLFFFFFFFFQAEDGIRDLYVTGVQTCALPIFCGVAWPLSLANLVLRDIQQVLTFLCTALMIVSPIAFAPESAPGPLKLLVRSEERRVGKECRCWWVRGA